MAAMRAQLELGPPGSMVATGASVAPPDRRSANWQPTLWHDSHIQTLTSDIMSGAEMAKLEELRDQVRFLIAETAGVAAKLDLLDLLRHLGVAYHFEQEIELVLQDMSTNLEDVRRDLDGDLLHTALLFRLLREQGHTVPQDIFDVFKDEKGNFSGSLWEDAEGMLSLYEATFIAFEGEQDLEKARAFSIACLNQYILDSGTMPMLKERVEYALETPLCWRAHRVHARWFIDQVYKQDAKANPLLLELSKLDFNLVQRAHRRDIKALSRWWDNLGLKKLSFTRDRMMECFFWALATASEPYFWLCRLGLTQVGSLITIIDDVYDVYGSIDELEAFTTVIESWDVDAMDELPNYMKVCFQALFDTTNELADLCFQRNGFNCVSYLKKSWIDLCKSYLVEARWYHSNHTPTLGEYIANGWISGTVPILLTHAYFFVSEDITKEALNSFEEHCDFIYWSSIVLRLNDDLGTSTEEIKRGDNPKAIQCYMYQRNVLEVTAREHIKTLVTHAWMKINEECSLNKHLPKSFVKATLNLIRMSHMFYQHGDGFGAPEKRTKKLVDLMLMEPIC